MYRRMATGLLAFILAGGSRLLSQDSGTDSKLILVQPPHASARMQLPEFFPHGLMLGPPRRNKYGSQFRYSLNMGDVARSVSTILTGAGYPDQGWFVVRPEWATPPNPAKIIVSGFAVVTRLEQIEDDGRSKSGGRNWALDLSPPSLVSFLDAVKLLLEGAPKGRYRVFLIWVSNERVTQRVPYTPRAEDWEKFLAEGAKAPLLRMMDGVEVWYGAGCYVFVYEYERSAVTGETVFVSSSRLTAEQHLKAAGIWEGLEKGGASQ